LFGLRFRQNAARALLMPRPDPGKRTPLWLQRLRAKDLLQVAGSFPDFPIVVETVRECLDDDLDLPRLRWLLDAIQAGTVRVNKRRGEIPSPFASELIFLFTAAYLYEWDDPKTVERKPASAVVAEDLLAPLLRGGTVDEWLDPHAVGQVQNRLRRLGRPPRSVDEMAEHLRLVGDLAPSEISGPMPGFLAELREAGRALTIVLGGTAEPERFISAEEESVYRAAFPADRPSDPFARDTIVRRFVQTHALIGLAELLARYPIGSVDAAELLERWAEEGKVVRLDDSGALAAADARWAERGNLAEMRRVSVALRRRESVAVAPEVFADFLVRRQRVHPASRAAGLAALESTLEQLQGFAAAAAWWENEILPRRLSDYRPAWLDELLARGEWVWRAAGTTGDEPRVAFLPRDFPGNLAVLPTAGDLSSDDQQVLDSLSRLGASFATDLARFTGLEPSRVRRALGELVERGLVTNDRFEPLRPGARSTLLALADATSARRGGLSVRARPRRALAPVPEGRWSRVECALADQETGLLAWASVLLDRYGVLTREILALEPWAPSWAQLAPLLARAEWRGEVRRGYFVEGLSGVQFALDDSAGELARLAAAPAGESPLVLVGATDPANLYGAGAPFDIELLDGGSARLPRQHGNFLVLRDGRPVLLIEAHGKRLTGLAWSSQSVIDSALILLPGLIGPARRVLKVETYNGGSAAESIVAGRLSDLGFVRDYPGMAYYAGW
jgi:ATP-dependent Lhr-like helicase